MADKLKKLLKKLPTGFQEEADAMDEAGLRHAIVDSENNITTSQIAMGDDADLQQLKEALKLASASYREVIKAQRAKIEYAVHRLREMGKLSEE